MRVILQALRRAWPGLAALPLLALPLAALLQSAAPVQQAGQVLEDAMLPAAPRPSQRPEALAVDIDDAALQAMRPQLGDWPYPRHVYALLLDYLREAGVRMVVFDIVFSGAREGDAAFARALSRRPDALLAGTGVRQALEYDRGAGEWLSRQARTTAPDAPAQPWADLILPQGDLLEAVGGGGVGLISTPLDDDGRLRRLPLLHQVHGRLLPALPLAALQRVSGQAWQLEGQVLHLGAQQWPLDEQGRVRPRLPADFDQVPSLGWGHLMAAALGAQPDDGLRAELAGRTLFIGSSAFFADAVMTPRGQVSGSRLLAASYTALQQDALLHPAAWPWQAALWLLAALPALWSWPSGRPQLASHLLGVGLSLAMIAALAWTLLTWGEVPALTGPLLALALGLALTALAQLRWQALANQRLRYERDVAAAANQAKTEFLANVSHEIRTPMNAVLGMAELLARTPLNEEQRHYVTLFHGAGQSLFELINDLLDLSKIEAGRLELSPRPLELEPLLRTQIELLAPRAEAKGLALELRMAPGLGAWVEGDPKRLAQVLVNLLGNAIKFTERGGVSLQASRPDGGDELLLVIEDSGIGIAPSKLELIFEPFRQADAGVERQFGGTGLGLAITRSLVHLMGGRIGLSSVPGEGSRFQLSLPLRELPAPAADTAASAAPPAAPATAPGPRHILLCEDNEVNVMVIQAMLAPEGHRLEVATNGAEGLHAFRASDFDLVLMDVQMPGMDGHETTRALRRLEAELGRDHTPVVALSANAYESDAQASLAAGCDQHLSKPVSRSALLALIAGLPARRSTPPTSSLTATAPALPVLQGGDGDPELKRRQLAHARVFIGAWRTAWQRAGEARRLPLARDLTHIAGQIGATEMAAASGDLATAIERGDSTARAAALARVEAELGPLMVALGRS